MLAGGSENAVAKVLSTDLNYWEADAPVSNLGHDKELCTRVTADGRRNDNRDSVCSKKGHDSTRLESSRRVGAEGKTPPAADASKIPTLSAFCIGAFIDAVEPLGRSTG